MTAKPPRRKFSVTIDKPDAGAAALYREGQAAQRRGDLGAADAAYRRVIAVQPAHFNALHMLGILEAQRGRPAEAEALFARALAIKPDDPNVHNNRANVLCALRRYDEAVQGFERAIALNPGYPDANSNLGKALYDQGRPLEALAHLERAVALKPDFLEAHFQRGLVLMALQRQEDALAAFESVLKIRPGHGDAHLNRGNLLRAMGRVEDALISFERAIAANPDSAQAHCNRGNTLHAMKQFPDALASIDRAIALKPGLALAHYLRSAVLLDLDRPAEALECAERGIALQPDENADEHNNRAVVLRRLNRFTEALAGFDRALALRPGYAVAQANRGLTLSDLGRVDEALLELDHAIEIDATRAESFNLRGNVLQDLNRHEDALRDYARARALRQDYAEAEWNESVCRLLHGDFAQGWPLFESRWRNGQNLGDLHLAQPLWDGRKVDGTLLVWGEQGIGDQIHQLGMVEGLAGRAGEVVVAVNERLLPLVGRSLPNMRVIGLKAANRAACEMQTPLGSLGRYLRRSWDEFPVARTAYLKADPARVAALAQALPGKARLTVGLSWHSIAPKVGRAKSMALQDLAPLLGIKGVRFVDLQYGGTAAERGRVRDALGVEVLHVDEIDNRRDLDGLAALISVCDVVVTISNTTAHLAGALGKPTLLMLPFGCARHWYWHEGRDDSPWYPSLHLYRQRIAGDWSEVFSGVRKALQGQLKQRSA